MTEKPYQPWGRYPPADQQVRKLYWRDETCPTASIGDITMLPFGNGRSYGDVCQNNGGVLLDCRHMNRFIQFDADTGVLKCEAGVLLSEILQLTVSQGWFLPVTPGTQYVTLGGAIANDVHGKNHHHFGTFGCHVRCFELLRSDGARHLCSAQDNPELYTATIAGLGLTGLITWAEIQLQPIHNAYINREIIRFQNLEEFFTLAHKSNQHYQHTVAWIDCMAKGAQLGRGLFTRGNYAEAVHGKPPKPSSLSLTFPIDPPTSLLNGLSLKLFNSLYFHKQRSDHSKDLVHYQPFFYPLDAIYAWNRIYGSKGFFQYQCAVPADQMESAIGEILQRVSSAGSGSFLAVLKLFGNKPSPGLLSFPMPGATLALDFPNNGNKTLQLLDQLDEVTTAVNGRVNPSKDARMSAVNFQNSYSNWKRMQNYIDPQFSSSFWRRVMEQL